MNIIKDSICIYNEWPPSDIFVTVFGQYYIVLAVSPNFSSTLPVLNRPESRSYPDKLNSTIPWSL